MTTLSKILASIALITFCCVSHSGFAQVVTDQDLKKNVQPVKNALSYVAQLKPKTFEFDTDRYAQFKLPAGQQYGFLAEDFQKVLPELVFTRSQTYQTGKNATKSATYKNYDLESLIPILVGAIQEQQAQIAELKRQLAKKQN